MGYINPKLQFQRDNSKSAMSEAAGDQSPCVTINKLTTTSMLSFSFAIPT
jgi:hypothetical protein